MPDDESFKTFDIRLRNQMLKARLERERNQHPPGYNPKTGDITIHKVGEVPPKGPKITVESPYSDPNSAEDVDAYDDIIASLKKD
jgi:hypothetical protein